MAVSRPWVTPEEVIAYTSFEDVQNRSTERLAFDIARAELKVIAITNNKFDDEDLEEIPEAVKMAVILLAEAYAKNNIESVKGNLTSEKYDDYSYTAESTEIDLTDLDLEDLLAEYIITDDIGKIVLKMRVF